MSDPEQRRRRQQPPPRSSAGGTGGGPLPMAALIVGVIVAGLGIGALVSAFQNRATPPELGPASIPAVTPVPQPSGPSPVVTLPPTPAPSPSLEPSVAASPVPSATPSAAPSPSPAAAQTTASTAAPIPSPAPLSATPAPSASPKPVAAATSAPTPVRPATALPLPAKPPVSPPPSAGDAATALVRRYIGDLIAGDEAGAYAALGGTSSDRSLDLKEEAFLDKDARITSIRVSRTDAAGETVDAEITSGRGSYVATFHVATGANGTIINQHDYIKI